MILKIFDGVHWKRQISALANSVRKLADMEEPIGRVIKKTEVKAIYVEFNVN